MHERRWLRIIPVALIMYTISYVDRTNVALALDPKLSPMMSFLGMDDKIKGNAVGIFFFGYLLLQVPSGYLANRWSARKLVSIFLVCWGLCAIGSPAMSAPGPMPIGACASHWPSPPPLRSPAPSSGFGAGALPSSSRARCR